MAAPTTTTPSPPAKRPLFQHPWRVAIVVVTLLVVLNLGILLVSGANTDAPSSVGLPSTIQQLIPGNGEFLQPADTIGIDLRDDLTGVLQVSCTGKSLDEIVEFRGEIPEDQLDRVVPLGQVTFRPGPDKAVTKWPAGTCTVVVRYWPQAKERPEQPSAYSWTFRVAA